MSFAKEFGHSQALFDAAIQEFAARGYKAASINTILKTASMSKGQFYYHFKNKEELYCTLIEVLINQKRAFLARVMQPDDFRQGLFQIFEMQIRHGLAFARAHPAVNRFAESFLKEKGNPIYATVLKKYNFDNDAAMGSLIAQAYQNGELRTDMPLAFMQKVIGHLFTHAAEVANLHEGEEREKNLAHLLMFMQSGLGSKLEHIQEKE